MGKKHPIPERHGRDRQYYRKMRKHAFTVGIGIFDFIIIGISVFLGYYLRFYVEIGVISGFFTPVPIAPMQEYLKALIFIEYILLILFILFKLYRRERSRWLIDEIHSIVKSLTFGYLILITLTFFIRTQDFQYSRTVLMYSYLASLLFLSLWRFIALKIERYYHLRGGDCSKILIVGSGEMARIIVKKMLDHDYLGYKVIGFTTVVSENVVDLETHPYLGSLDEFERVLSKHDFDEIFICEPELSHFKLLEIVSLCEEQSIEVKMAPNVYDLLIDFADVSDLDGLPLVAVREQPMYEVSLFVKRTFDIFFSSIILLLTSPLCILITVLIKLDSRGPIIFSQKRAGVGGIPFRMFKFRTMLVNAETQLGGLIDIDNLQEPVFKIQNDPRVTGVGRYLRRTSLDELLQFWNVLKGDMSVVGPRPEETQLVDKYNIWQRRRLKIKPGITGMQQVMCRGTTSLADRIKFDIYYLRKHSLLLDIWIIFKTIPVVISGKGAC